MKRLLYFALLLLLSALFYGCGKEGGEAGDFDVQFEIPKNVTVKTSDLYLSFRIMFGKAPLKSDKIILGDPGGNLKTCAITAISGGSFTFALYEGMVSGNYNVYIERGGAKKLKGVMTVTVDHSTGTEEIQVEPAAGSTVYGVVASGAKGLKDVVVSDGVEVVTTDANGIYQLKSAKKFGYVWISVPGGYETASEGILPVFWQTVDSKSPSTPERRDFALSEAPNDDFTMYVLGDMHLAGRNSVTGDMTQFRLFTDDLNARLDATPGKEYAMTLGDMTWDIFWFQYKFSLSDYLNEMNRNFSGLQVFHAMGNHDNDFRGTGDFGKEQAYRDLVAPTFYSYNIGKVHFIVLDDINFKNTVADTYNPSTGKMITDNRDRYSTDLTREQLEWLKKDLSHVAADTPVIISTHAPVYRPFSASSYGNGLYASSSEAAGTDEIVAALSGYNVHFFTGHTHKICNRDLLSAKGVFEHNAGSVCGTWWWSGHYSPGINIAQDGAPGGYTVLTVKGKELSWVYKSTGYPETHQFRSYDMNEVKKVITSGLGGGRTGWDGFVSNIASYGTDEVLLNVWNYDPKWTLSVMENGKSLTVTPVWQYDPLHILVLSANKDTFQTTKWNHFFKVKTSSPSSTLEIKVTDRFGNTYSETMTRPKAFNAGKYRN